MKVNIKDLYVGAIGRFTGYVHVNGRTYIDFDKLQPQSFYVKQGSKYFDIFTGRGYNPMTSRTGVPEEGYGLVEPEKFVEYMPYDILQKVEKNPMIDIEDLRSIARKMDYSMSFGYMELEKTIKTKKFEYEM